MNTSLLLLLLTFLFPCHGQQGNIKRKSQSGSLEISKRDATLVKQRNGSVSHNPQMGRNRIYQHQDPKSLVEIEKLLLFNHAAKLKKTGGTNSLPVSVSFSNEHGNEDSSLRLRGADKNEPLGVYRRLTSSKCGSGLKKIVQCNDGVLEDDCKQTLVAQGVQVVSDMHGTPYFAICADSQEEVDLVAKLTDVHGVEDDPPRTLSYLPGSSVKRSLQAAEQVVPYGVDLVKAREFWEEFGAQGEGVTVCMIDTGLLTTHEDIKEGDFSGSDDKLFETWDEDLNSHGTHTSGTIMATDNNVGVIGVAPGVSIYVVSAFDAKGEFTASDLVESLNACEQGGAKIISMSLGGAIKTAAEQATIKLMREKGILMVAASGNLGEGLNMVAYPASYDEVISVAAVDEQTRMAAFSTFNLAVDIAAPGVDIVSTSAEGDTSYSIKSGTSMATPHIAATAALLWSKFPESDADEIRSALLETARDSGACGKDRLFGNGVVDVLAAGRYLEAGGIANATAPELDNCINVTVTLVTDDWGHETSFRITSANDSENILYRGGPYPSGQRDTYTDDFLLPGGCYALILLDSYGDGTNTPENGIGEISLSYNKTKQVDFDDFGGFSKVFRFGNCVESGQSPVAGNDCGNGIVDDGEECDDGNLDNTDECSNQCELARCGDDFIQADVEDCDDGNTIDGDGCSSNCKTEGSDSNTVSCSKDQSLLELLLETDSFSLTENQLYLYDDAAPTDEFIWEVEIFELNGNDIYEGSACLDLATCYKFVFLDSVGDGLEAGGLTLKLDGDTVLEIVPGDTGTVLEAGSRTTFWFQSFGPCTDVSMNRPT